LPNTARALSLARRARTESQRLCHSSMKSAWRAR